MDPTSARLLPWIVALAAGAAAVGLIALDKVETWHAVLATSVVASVAIVALGYFGTEADRPRPDETNRPGNPIDLKVEGLIAAIREPVVLVDPRGVVRAFNPAAAAVVAAIRRGEALALALRAPEVIEAVKAVAVGGSSRAVDFAERVPIERWFRVVVTPTRITLAARDGGAPDLVLITLRDLTEERRLERLRTDFVANASHELRTPLASVIGFIETIQGAARNDPPAREKFLAIMLAQAQRMARLIDDLLSLSRIEQNEHVRPSAPVDLVLLLGQVRDALEPQAAASGVAITLTTNETSLVVPGDRDELFRLFENLLQNAIKYGAEGKSVEITLRRDLHAGRPQEAAVTIRDHGPGIAREHLPRLTERFYRVDVAASREKGGTGLGLALVKHILARHRGRLAVESEPGEGAVFTVRLETLSATMSQAS